MKKLLLGLGSIATVVAPVITVVSCGGDDSKTSAAVSFEYATDGFAFEDNALGGKFLISKEAAKAKGEMTITNGAQGAQRVTKKITWDAAIAVNSLPKFKEEVTSTTNGTTSTAPAKAVQNPAVTAVTPTMFIMTFDGSKRVVAKTELDGMLQMFLATADGKNIMGIKVEVDSTDKTKLSEDTITSINELLKPIDLAVKTATAAETTDPTTNVVTIAVSAFTFENIKAADIKAAKDLAAEISKVSVTGTAKSGGYTVTSLASQTADQISTALLAKVTPSGTTANDLTALIAKMKDATKGTPTFKFGIKKALTAAGSTKAQIEVSINGCTPQLAEITITLS